MSNVRDQRPADSTASTDAAPVLLKALVLRGNDLEAAARTAGAAQELSADEWLILDALAVADGLSMSALSTQTLSSGASLTRAMDRLVGRSLVYRSPSVRDRRRVEVRISATGRDLHAKMGGRLGGIEASLRSALAQAGVDPDAVAAALTGFHAHE